MTNKITTNFAGLKFANSYTKLPEAFYERIFPTRVKSPTLIRLNKELAAKFGLDIKELSSNQGAEFFSGNFIAEGSEPIALAYAGHQFGNFVPQLGDGRAILLGEITDKNNKHFDIQLKGSGQTKFSRRGDGRAALGPVMREYIISEAMHNLGISTTRSFAFVTTGEYIQRETILPGAIITRIASSHIRVGTFQYFAAKGDLESVKTLCDYTIKRHYPECSKAENPYIELFAKISDAQAKLIASWMCIGFIHGVMNTDNTSIAGETIDYGPCAFMDKYNPATVFSSIDVNGRYAYINQPYIGRWNLTRLAECLLPLFGNDAKQSVPIAEGLLDNFYILYENYYMKNMRRKIGLIKENENDESLIKELLSLMHNNNLDFTNTFRNLADMNKEKLPLKEWLFKWDIRTGKEDNNKDQIADIMNNANPAFIPRNHLVQAAIHQAVNEDKYEKMDELIKVLKQPYKYKEEFASYTNLPSDNERVTETFCGT